MYDRSRTAIHMSDRTQNKLMVTKFLRVFTCSLISIILPIYLLRDGWALSFVGLITSLTILSAIPFNILVTYYVRRIGERRLLIGLSVLMALSGVLFAWSQNFIMLIMAAIIGLVSANGTETGPFQSIEQAILSTMADEKGRTKMFGYYNLVGYVAMSLGSLFSGLPDYLANLGVEIKVAFYIYTAAAILQGLIYLTMKELDGMCGDDTTAVMAPKTKRTVARLSALFSVDAFGGGFIIKNLLTTWFYLKYGMALEELAVIFFVADIITAISIVLAPRVAKRIGLLNTMVLTHLISNIFLILVPFAPTPELSVGFLFIRQTVSQMDVPARQSYTMAIIRSEDRAAAAAVTNTSRTVAQSVSPPISTALMDAGAFVFPFLLGGAFKIAYDVSIYLSFRKIKPPEECKTSAKQAQEEE
jgi:MFS family permease